MNRAAEFVAQWLEKRGVHTALLQCDGGRLALYASAVPGKEHDAVFGATGDGAHGASEWVSLDNLRGYAEMFAPFLGRRFPKL